MGEGVRELLVRFLVKRSTLLRLAVANRPGFKHGADPDGVFLSGTATYLMKLPPALLGADYAKPLDFKLAHSYPPSGMRLRVRSMARLVADSVADALTTRPAPRIDLVNIGGGPAVDSWNALLLLRREHPELLHGRTVHVHVLDRDASGPAFGARAFDSLREENAPLHDVDLTFQHVPYDWDDPAPLRALLPHLHNSTAVVSSEGALFDYGSDDAILGNLLAVRELAPTGVSFCGDFIPDSEVNRLSARETLLSARLFTPRAFEALVGRAGFRFHAPPSAENCVRLVRASA